MTYKMERWNYLEVHIGTQSTETNFTVNMERIVAEDECASDPPISQPSHDQESKGLIILVGIPCRLTFKPNLSLVTPTANTSLGLCPSHHNAVKTKRWHHFPIYYLHQKPITQENKTKPPHPINHIMPHIPIFL